MVGQSVSFMACALRLRSWRFSLATPAQAGLASRVGFRPAGRPANPRENGLNLDLDFRPRRVLKLLSYFRRFVTPPVSDTGPRFLRYETPPGGMRCCKIRAFGHCACRRRIRCRSVGRERRSCALASGDLSAWCSLLCSPMAIGVVVDRPGIELGAGSCSGGGVGGAPAPYP
jgi:hypothetical protein